MRIITVVFDYNGADTFERLLPVFEHSVGEHEPTASFEVVRMPAPDRDNTRQRGLVSNTYKLREWVRILRDAAPDDEIVFTDCDMLMIGSIADAFDYDFDVAYTRRRAQLPLNGGVVFVRPTDAAVDFFELWLYWNERFYADPAEHQPWKTLYGGMNQAALGKILHEVPVEATVIALPCETYNAVDSDWGSITDNCRMIHCKGNLRRAIFAPRNPRLHTGFSDATKALAYRWHEQEKRALAEARRKQ